MTDAAYDAEVPERNPLCWRCRKARVRVSGTPCQDCRVVLLAEYHEARAANGGRFLYLPQSGPLPMMSDRARPTAKASRMCEECARDFEYTPGIGRPPRRCPECRGGSRAAEPEPAPKKREPKAIVRTTQRAEVAPIMPPPPPAVPETNGNEVNVAAVTERVMQEVAQLEDAIAIRLRVVRTLEQYARTTPAGCRSPNGDPK